MQQIKIPVVNTDYTGRGLYILRSIRWEKELSETELNPNIRIIGVPEEEDKKKGHEKTLEEIIAENFPKMG